MNINETISHQQLSHAGADYIINKIEQKPDSLICIASGGSPKLMYKLIAEKIKSENIDISKIRIIALDEWHKLPTEHPATCYTYIQKYVIEPWGIPNENVLLFNSYTDNPKDECTHIANQLKKIGPIDICILGIGRNGHLGLNEPGIERNSTTHVAKLHESSTQHYMLTTSDTVVSHGMTLGIQDILQSKNILFLVTGKEKKDAFKAFQNKETSSQWPANFLWEHENVTCIVDESSIS